MVAYTVKILMYYLLLRSGSAFRRSSITVRSNKGYLADSQSLLRRVITSMADTSDSAVADSLAMLSPAIETVKKEPPNAMLSHLRTRIVWALETWHGGDGIDANMRNDIAGNVVDAIIRKREANATDGDTREQNKMLVNYGQIVAKAIRATPGSIQELKVDINVLDSTINTYQLHLEKNRAVYININRHHESLVKKSYSAAVQNVTSLEVYAEAANSMGKKVWVQQGNLWMEDFSINFFRRNGARKDYLKAINHDPNREGQREMATALPRDLMLEETFLKDTEENSNSVNMLETDSPPARLIRLVDVGSCYNPIGKSANQAAFSVTPLDLCPVDPSVYQCDFLDLEIGPKGSVPVIVPAATTVQEHSENITAVSSGTENGPEKSTESKSPKLLRLPAASYDAVAMSLVLNYLPTPALREKMIKKARQLLIPPGEGGQPHRAGILLIIEKESIFSYDRIQSDVYHNKSTLLNCWKETICSLGFELVRYRNILTTEDHRRCHALAFRTIQIPEQTAESSIEISEEHSAEHSAITEPSEASTSTTTNSSGIRYTDQLMLAKSLANKKLFEAGKSGMWIKQDFSSGPTEKKNNYNRNYKDLQDTFAVNQRVLKPTEGDNNADADGSDGDSVGGWDADGLGVISGKTKAKTKASSTVTPTSIDNTIKSNTNSNSNSNSKSASPITLPVAIVGGGLGGCALALALQRKGIPYVMYEKDSHFASRKQGYALTLQQGGASLRMLGLEGEYKTRGVPSLAHESYASDGTLLGAYGASVRKGLLLEDTVVSGRDGAEEEMDRDELCDSAVVDMIAQGNVLEMTEDGVHYIDETSNQGVKEVKEVKETGGKKSNRRLEKAQSRHNVHISRQQLRDLLMSNILPSSVVWGKSFSHFIEKDDSVEVCFQDGSSVDASVLVAADGIYSTVRKQLIPQSEDETKSLSKGLNYLGLMVILGISPVVIGARASVNIPPPCDQPSFSETGVKSTGESSGSIPSFDSITMTADDSTDIDIDTATATGNEERAGTSKKRRIEDSVVDSDYRQSTTAGSSSSSLPPIENIESTVLPRSQCQWLDGSTRVFTMPFDRSHTMWQLSFPCTEEEALILASNPTLLKQKALEQCAGWHSPLVTLLSVTDLGMVSGHPAYDRDPLKISDMLRTAPSSCDSDSTGREKGNRSGKKQHQQQHQQQQQHQNRPLTQSTITSSTSSSSDNNSNSNSNSNSSSNRPDETTSAPQGSPVRALKRVPFCRVTLLGDAAHPMSPFKAQGANQALLDALCLSTALVSSELAKAGRRSLSDALDSYEQEMSVRSAVKVLKSRAAAASLHSPSALATGNETRASVAENALII